MEATNTFHDRVWQIILLLYKDIQSARYIQCVSMHLLTPMEGEEYLTSVASVGWSAELSSHCVSLEKKHQGYIIKCQLRESAWWSRVCSVIIEWGLGEGHSLKLCPLEVIMMPQPLVFVHEKLGGSSKCNQAKMSSLVSLSASVWPVVHKERETHRWACSEGRHEDSWEMSHEDLDRDAKGMSINQETLGATG